MQKCLDYLSLCQYVDEFVDKFQVLTSFEKVGNEPEFWERFWCRLPYYGNKKREFMIKQADFCYGYIQTLIVEAERVATEALDLLPQWKLIRKDIDDAVAAAVMANAWGAEVNASWY